MFTGIVTGIGRITRVDALGAGADHGKHLVIQTPKGYLSDVTLGDSIAINGACMTVTHFNPELDQFEIDISAESLRKTAGLADQSAVNLEKALRAHERLGGHIVTGHVDGLGVITHFSPVGESWELRIRADKSLGRFLAYKGSITVNGTSLTVNQVQDSDQGCEFSINVIPHTLQNTTLGQLVVGQHVNLEVDLIARYVERMLSSLSPASHSQPSST